MPFADENLWNGVRLAASYHFRPKLCIVFDINFIEAEVFCEQQLLGSLAIPAPVGDINSDLGAVHLPLDLPPEILMSGKLSLTHASVPPCRLNTWVKPSLPKVLAALALLLPLSQ